MINTSDMNLDGPFIRNHPVWNLISLVLKDFPVYSGRTYENEDTYAALWFTVKNTPKEVFDSNMVAITVREKVNSHFGYCILSKPKFAEANDDSNPYTSAAIFMEVLPRSVGIKAEKFGGDPLIAALADCKEAGVIIRI